MQRRFVFLREDDPTGISGTGKVVEGVMYSDGRCAYRWMTDHRTDQSADDVETLEKVHGHNGRTRIVFLDDPDGNPYPGVLQQLRWLEAGDTPPTVERR